jgi:hypothetical protein
MSFEGDIQIMALSWWGTIKLVSLASKELSILHFTASAPLPQCFLSLYGR